MTTHTVAKAFTTRTRRLAAGVAVTAADLADDALGWAKRLERGDIQPETKAPAAPKKAKGA